MAYPEYTYLASTPTFVSYGNVELPGIAGESACFCSHQCKKVMPKREMAGPAGVGIERDARWFERGYPYRSVSLVYCGGYFGEDVTAQQKYGGGKYSGPLFSSTRDYLSDVSSTMPVLSDGEMQEKKTAGRFSDGRGFPNLSIPFRAEKQMPDRCSLRQNFERYEMPIAGTDFSGNNPEQRSPLTSNDINCHNPLECITPDFYVQEQIYVQRKEELSRYQDLIDEARSFFPANTLNEYIQEFLSGKREELELSRLFSKYKMPRSGVCGTTSGQFSLQKKVPCIPMTGKQKKQLRTILERQKPTDFGINDRKWTAMNVRNLINDLFQLDYNVSSVKHIIHTMKLTFRSINDSNSSTPTG